MNNRAPTPLRAAADVLSAAVATSADRVIVTQYGRATWLTSDAKHVLAIDNDVGAPDGVIDPGDVVTTTLTITNNSRLQRRSPPPACSSTKFSTA
jgi:hypothetical protein